MKNLLLIDGHNLLFQMFYGMPSRITNLRGEPIQGTLGFTGALFRIIRMLEPTHIAVLFDGERNARVYSRAACRCRRRTIYRREAPRRASA